MTIDRAKAVEFINKASDIMNENKDYLIELDSALGDGDLGLTMSTGFGKAKEEANKSDEQDLGKLFFLIGSTIAKAVPSTMGTLVASGFMKSAKALKGKTELTLGDLATFAEEFVTGIMERGKAKPGDRTIIDSLKPAAESLRNDAEAGSDIKQAIEKAYSAALEGVEATKNMKAAFGRGVFFGDKVLGKPDQGAIVGSLIYKAWNEVLA